MSNVSKILIVFIFGVLTTSAFARNISELKIKKIKLGMSQIDVLKVLSCRPKIHTNHIDYVNKINPYETYLVCKTDKQKLTIVLDRFRKVKEIYRVIGFNVEPSWGKLEKDYINHYGNTRNITHKSSCQVASMCWGGCKYESGDFGTIKNQKTLTVEFYNCANENSNHYISVVLKDDKRIRNNSTYKARESKLLKSKQKEKASNVDF